MVRTTIVQAGTPSPAIKANEAWIHLSAPGMIERLTAAATAATPLAQGGTIKRSRTSHAATGTDTVRLTTATTAATPSELRIAAVKRNRTSRAAMETDTVRSLLLRVVDRRAG